MTPSPQIPSTDPRSVPDPVPDDLHVLDVREDAEWDDGHIAGAQHIPLGQLPTRAAEVPHQRTLVVCRSGGRSAQATGYLLSEGRDAVNLSGGMEGWSAAGRAMVSETGSQPTVR